MTADYFTTIWASPFYLLTLQKPVYSMLLYESQVFNHTYPIKGHVAFLEVKQIIAWKRVAFIAKIYLMIAKCFAFFLDKRALFISGATTFTIRQFYSFRSNIIYHSKIATANTAVHSTGRYEFIMHIEATENRL